MMQLIEKARVMAFDLREASKDWNGQFQPDGADPIHPVTCVELRDLAHLIDALASAIIEERDRCAKIAAAWGERKPVTTDDAHIPGADHGERYASAGIADAIRNRT
jgi:hypothetical protein